MTDTSRGDPREHFPEDPDERVGDDDLQLLTAYAENRLNRARKRRVKARLGAEPALRKALSAMIRRARDTEYEEILYAANQNPVEAVIHPLSQRFRRLSGRDGQTRFSLSPRFLAAVATACLAVVLILAGIDRNASTVSIKMTLIGNPDRLPAHMRGAPRPAQGEFELNPGDALASGDYFKIRFEMNRSAHVYVIFHDSTGWIDGFFFGEKEGKRPHLISEGISGFQLDEAAGTETVYLLAAQSPISEFDRKLAALRQEGIDEIESLFPKAAVHSFSFRHQ